MKIQRTSGWVLSDTKDKTGETGGRRGFGEGIHFIHPVYLRRTSEQTVG
jgi:hypothetical protein